MGNVIAENLTSPDHPTLKSNDIENKNINFSSVKIEVEEEEQKKKDLGLVDGSSGRIESAPTMLTSADSDSIGYIISSDSSGYSYSDGDEWSPLKGEPSSSIVPICSTEPANFKKIVEEETKLIEYKPVKITNQQEDAHEFLQCFLNQLESCCDYLETKDNIVMEVFGGHLVSKLHCCNCGHTSVTREPLIDISLEIEDVDSVPNALESFTKIEKIKFSCERCKTQGPFGKQLLIDHAPTVATLHLKRFKNNGLVAQKVGKHVLFPLELDMLLYTNDINNEEMKYDLYAVIVHSGPSISSGHYYTFIRCAPNEWYKFDDEKVDYVQEYLVLAEEAYIMFYAKRGTPWFFDYCQTHRPFVCFVTPTTSNDTSNGTSLKPELNKIEDNDSHDQVYCEDQLQDVEIKQNEESMDTLNRDSHGSSLNEKKRKLED
ncbi:hypothetical protein MTR67_034740 [Solanum verrucosum]|uniref:USP domain-containing protein n=1 Tax=Solanum verrucosum TaxID=315347 RepID=A0AAF0U8X4_SOLVR|nr:hypothetical protein MTR67_034740 [Solanum verrucosum]